MKREERQHCELCKGEASVYCEADAAFLCWACDERVHGANFLVGRHVRVLACDGCGSFAAGNVAGSGFVPIYTLCGSCDPAVLSSTSSCSSSCFSTAESASPGVAVAGKAVTRKRRRRKAIVGEEMTRWSETMEKRSARMAMRVPGENEGSSAEVAMAAEVRTKKRKGGSARACERALRSIEACQGYSSGRLESRTRRLTGRLAKEGHDELF